MRPKKILSIITILKKKNSKMDSAKSKEQLMLDPIGGGKKKQ
jgi:hypothetical protein